MTILSGDIKLLKSDTMADSPEGGGAVTGQVIVDGQSNNIFDDISTLDRVYGAVHMRKIFGAIQTQNKDKFYGSHLIISKLPADTKLGINLFKTGDWFDRRPVAQTMIENYRAQGALYVGYLWATQYKFSRVVTIFQNEKAPLPGVGDVLMLKSPTAQQYIRIIKMQHSIQTFVDEQGEYKKRIVELEISERLDYNFVGSQMSRYDNLTPESTIFKTVVADAARYYSARPLGIDAVSGQASIRVDTLYSQVVPSSQAESAIVDQTAGGSSEAVIDSANGVVTFSLSDSLIANKKLYLGSAILPGSLSITGNGANLVDDGGSLKSGQTAVGTVSYADGTVLFLSSSPTYPGTHAITFKAASVPNRLADTASVPVTGANRGYVWVINASPPPKPKSLKVMYRSFGKWYELNDNGNGGVLGTDDGIGSGTCNYVTGSVSVSLAAMPDVGSEVIFSWGNQADFNSRANVFLPQLKIKKQLQNQGVSLGTLVITWNDGAARTLTSNASGVLSGYGSGKFIAATNTVEFTPNSLPLGGTQFTFAYDYGTGNGAQVSESFSNVSLDGSNQLVLPLTDAPYPGSVAVQLPTVYKNIVNTWSATNDSYSAETIYMQDNGVGGFVSESGSINYAGKTITLPNSHARGRKQKTPTYGDMSSSGFNGLPG